MALMIDGTPKSYAWGSRTKIPQILGGPPAAEPLAELWFGTHPSGPSAVLLDGGTASLDRYLAENPELLGGYSDLPYLTKILTADKALSLQVHPSREQAERGHAGEVGWPRFGDPNPKPELVIAMSRFRALSGFQPRCRSLAVASALDVPLLTKLCRRLHDDGAVGAPGRVLAALLALPRSASSRLVDDVIAAAENLISDQNPTIRRYAELTAVLAADHPRDIGIVAAMLLNDIELNPGEALYQPSGVLHAYVRGTAVEVMGNSDNVLRGGLTGKPVDIDGLLAILEQCSSAPRMPRIGEMSWWQAPDGNFMVRQLGCNPAGISNLTSAGPSVLICTEGSLIVNDGQPICISAGHAAFVPAGTRCRVAGPGRGFAASCPGLLH